MCSDSIDTSTFNLDPTYSEQGTEAAGTSSQTSTTSRKLAVPEVPTMVTKAMGNKILCFCNKKNYCFKK